MQSSLRDYAQNLISADTVNCRFSPEDPVDKKATMLTLRLYYASQQNCNDHKAILKAIFSLSDNTLELGSYKKNKLDQLQPYLTPVRGLIAINSRHVFAKQFEC